MEEMIEGTEVLWESWFSYLDLMKIREENGIKAFNQEYLGNPTDEERQIFKEDDFVFFTEADLYDKPVDYIMAIDFAMGKEKGDYSCIAVLARNKLTGICYVYDMFLQRVHPDILLREAINMTMQYQPEVIAVEAQMAQEWFADRLGAELKLIGYPAQTRLKQVKQRSRKALRIESLLPDIQAGRLRFRKQDTLVLEMFQMYPMHRHDDAPDAIQMAFEAAKQRFGSIKMSRKRAR
jgi:predicted phage terminase large subunit-like protein